MPLNLGLGWRADVERRDLLRATARPMAFAAPYSVPAEIDHRGWLPIVSQGQMGSCAGHAIRYCLTVLNWIQTRGQVVDLSRMFLYLNGQRESGFLGSDCGSSIYGAVKGAKDYGACYERTFPYPQQYNTNVPQTAYAEGKQHLLRQHVVCNTYDACFQALASGVFCIDIGIAWYDSLRTSNGLIEHPGYGQNWGGHSLCFLGYSRRKDAQGKNYLWMANSHGVQWGNKGWAEVAPSVVSYWLQGSEFYGVTDLQAFGAFRPRTLYWGSIAA